MFYAPKTVASMVTAIPAGAEFASAAEFYSDQHKDAIGCRPRQNLIHNRVEAAVEVARLDEWAAESSRLEPMRIEIARFDFSRRIEYYVRRENMTRLEAFEYAIRVSQVCSYPNDEVPTLEEALHDGWEYVSHCLGLPYDDAKQLETWHTELLAL